MPDIAVLGVGPHKRHNSWTKYRPSDVKAGATEHRDNVMLPRVEEERQR